MSSRQGYFADKEFGRFTAADKERQLEEAQFVQYEYDPLAPPID